MCDVNQMATRLSGLVLSSLAVDQIQWAKWSFKLLYVYVCLWTTKGIMT